MLQISLIELNSKACNESPNRELGISTESGKTTVVQRKSMKVLEQTSFCCGHGFEPRDQFLKYIVM